MQTLYVKGPDGKTKEVHIIRSFQDISGKQIFLHANGTYADRAGVPVKSETELQILPPEHRKVALAWWERTGRKQAETHYAALAEKESVRAGDFQEKIANDEANSALDSILYARQDLNKGKKGAISAPKPWMEYGFSQRPDWWGQAQTINFKDFSYRMQTTDSPEPAPGTEKDTTGD